jgi:hypothetical protein
MNKLELAELILKQFTPFAFTCKETDCDCKRNLTDSDYIEYTTVNRIATFIIKQHIIEQEGE